MTRALAEFQRSKALLLEAYDKFESAGAVPVEPITVEGFTEKRQALEDERFVLAVCGQMKSGKSTLLNALVFGRPVLPFDDTVTTAKVTVLSYREQPGFVVRFYDQNEWDQVRKAFGSESSDGDVTEGNFGRAFSDEVERADRAGVQPSAVIEPVAKVIEEKDLGRLVEYVALVDRGGRFSPFVKEVTVFHQAVDLRDIDVVDTPGINDPNPVRDRMTKEWIHRATAVVYVAYAMRAFDATDFNFIERYLIGIPGSKRLLAVNKVDVASDLDGVRRYVESLRSSADPRVRAAVPDRASTVFVSALGGLLASMLEQELALPTALSDELLMHKSRGENWQDASAHCIPQLRICMEERLLRNRGESIIEEHRIFLRSIVERHRRGKESSFLAIDERFAAVDQELTKVRELKAKWVDVSESVKEITKELDENVKNAVNEQRASLRAGIVRLRTTVVDKMLLELRDVNIINGLPVAARSALGNALDVGERILYDAVEKYTLDVNEVFVRLLADATNELARAANLSIARISSLVRFIPTDSFGDLRQELRRATNIDALHELIAEKVGWWARTWDTRKGLENARVAIHGVVIEVFDESFEKVVNQVVTHAELKANGAIERLRKQIDKAREEIDASVIRAAVDEENRQQEMSRLQSERKSLEEKWKAVGPLLKFVPVN